MNTVPNFLIVGAAKCGTSSFASYLSQHPEVFMTNPKEPRFITSQFTSFPIEGPKANELESWYAKTYEDYIKLFQNVKKEKAIGEASVDNLFFYKQAIPLIKQYFGEPKIIILLRDPVKRAFSAYSHLVRDERESLSFEEALEKQDERRNKNWEFLYSYIDGSRYYEQVKAYLDNFQDVLIIKTEDLHKNPHEVFKTTFSFLDINPNFEVNQTIRYNESGMPKSRFIYNFFQKDSKLRKALQPITRTLIPSTTRKILSNKIQSQNLKKIKMEEETKRELYKIFKEDILKLQKLTKVDFSDWIKD